MEAFRITPAPPPELQPGEWVGEGDSYTGSPGSEWWHNYDTEDIGWDEERIIDRRDNVIVDDDAYNENDVGDLFNAFDTQWEIEGKFIGFIILFGIKTPIYWLNLIKKETIHHPEYKYYYNVYKYEFMNWVFIRSEER